MQETTKNQSKRYFLIGNVLLGLSLILLIFMGTLWEYLGGWAMALWIVFAAAGMYLVLADKGHSSTLPD